MVVCEMLDSCTGKPYPKRMPGNTDQASDAVY